ncbi:hypothetical protein F5141DRAFT_1139895 [Pisolithus sp. B1]|nr:hypothetical protein F5141DRAFT_1139895 [Pisolithus sp. B1]
MNLLSPAPPTIYGLFTPLDARYPERQSTYCWETHMTNWQFPSSSRCFVEKVTWHKSNSVDQHEFLRFTIRAPYGPHSAVVVVGRTVQITSVTKLSAIFLTSSGCCASSESLAQSAVDEVTAATVGTWRGDELMDNHNCRLVSSLTFPSRAPSADELSTLLAVVSSYREKYHLLESQCFWYARTAFKALMELFEGKENPGDGSHKGGRIHSSKLPSSGTHVHEICRMYKQKREALPQSPDRVHADPTTRMELQALREEAESCRQALEATEMERQQVQRQNEQLLLELQMLKAGQRSGTVGRDRRMKGNEQAD